MKEIRLCFYKSLRKNSKFKYHTHVIFDPCDNPRVITKFKKNMAFYDFINVLILYNKDFQYVTIAATNYSENIELFSSNDFGKSNVLDIPESKRFRLSSSRDMMEIIKLIYHYMILLGSDFSYDYNPFKDENVLYWFPALKAR